MLESRRWYRAAGIYRHSIRCAERSLSLSSEMELLGTLVRGFIVGFSIAAAVGPISLLCIRKTLAHGRLAGFVCGMGAATADGLYSCVAAFSLTWVSDLLVEQQPWLRLAGGLFLIYLGARTFLEKPVETADSNTTPVPTGLARSYASTFALTVFNPMTILSFAAIFAGLGLGETGGGYTLASTLVAGVFAGSALWWILLSTGVGLLRSKLETTALRWINRVSGAFLLGFGVVALGILLNIL
jgi:threonine/homoserine/homoserine lactone efflux protein